MKKFILIFFVALVVLAPLLSYAKTDPACAGPDGKFGIVTCGCGNPIMGPDGKCTNCCEIEDFFGLLANVYDFIVKYIATTLAVIMITVGAIFLLTSAGDPGRAGTGRKMITYSIIGLVLVFGSWIIIDTLLGIIGYQAPGGGSWFNLP